MFFEIVPALLLGVLAGCFTGLVPGIHTNLVVILLVSVSSTIKEFLGDVGLLVFIVAMSVTHSFVSTIPSIYLGAPESGTSLSVLPGHKLLLEGKGYEAVKLTVVGSVLSVFICTLLYPFFRNTIYFLYSFFSDYIGHMLVLISVFLVFRTKTWRHNIYIFGLSGFLGYIVLSSNMDDPLFPLLSGLFGIATLAYSLKTQSSFPKQEINSKINISEANGFLNSLFGTVAGFITCILPGLGSSTAAVICSFFKRESEAKEFLIMIGSITTVNFFMSLAALEVIDRARNGSIVGISELISNPPHQILFVSAILSAAMAAVLCLFLAKICIKLLVKINYVILVKVVIALIFVLVYVITGFLGVYVLLLSFFLGYMVNLIGAPRNILMSCILVPVTIFFLF